MVLIAVFSFNITRQGCHPCCDVVSALIFLILNLANYFSTLNSIGVKSDFYEFAGKLRKVLTTICHDLSGERVYAYIFISFYNKKGSIYGFVY